MISTEFIKILHEARDLKPSCKLEEMVKLLKQNNSKDCQLFVIGHFIKHDRCLLTLEGLLNYLEGIPERLLFMFDWYGDDEVMKIFEGYDLDFNIVDGNGRSPIHYACNLMTDEALHVKTVDFMIKNGADVNAVTDFQSEIQIGVEEYYTPLMIAADSSSLKLVKLLLAHGADPSLASRKGDLAINVAKKRGCKDCIAYIKKAL